MHKAYGCLLTIVLSALALPIMAQESAAAPAAQPPEVVDLAPVVVSGAQPGPGLWKVSKGDHVLWILGSLSPLPKRMEWQSAEVERTIAASQEALKPPRVKFDANVGFFRGLFLLPSLYKARKNPDRKTLRDVLTPEQYARWQILKARYIGSDRGIESWRPLYVALELYDKAIAKSGMTQKGVVAPVLEKVAKKYKVKVTSPELTIEVPNAKAALKEFTAETLDDSECFSKTLDRIETDLGNMVARANAWAVGDIVALRDLPAHNQHTACTAAITETGVARKLGMHDLTKQLRTIWLKDAEAALSRNASTFSVLPISLMLEAGGYLDMLRARGYQVQAPGEYQDASAAPATPVDGSQP